MKNKKENAGLRTFIKILEGLGIAGRDFFVGYIGYLLKDGVTIHGTDTYTPPVQNATPIVSQTSQYWNTSPIGYGLMAAVALDALYQGIKAYRTEKMLRNQQTLEDKITTLDNKVKNYDRSLNKAIGSTSKYVIGKITTLDNKVAKAESLLGEIQDDVKHMGRKFKGLTKYLSGTKETLEETKKNTKENQNIINKLYGRIYRATELLSGQIPKEKRKEIVNKESNGGEKDELQ